MKWMFESRKRVILVALLLLLVLDLGRSAYARIGYAKPIEPWKEISYDTMKWPPAADLNAGSTPQGKYLYVKHCAVCHGVNGRGDGPASPSMIPRPRDFTQGLYKYKSTMPVSVPSDDDLARTIYAGLQGSAMPSWAGLLNDAEVKAVLEYIKGFSPRFKNEPVSLVKMPARIDPTPQSIAAGEAVFRRAGCNACHGDDLRGGKKLFDNKDLPVFSRDLTAPWTFRGGSTAEELWLRITTGLAPSPMPSFSKTLSDEDRWHVVNYILSKSRTPAWEKDGVLDGPGFYEDTAERGAYLTHTSMCGLCHTQVNSELVYSGDQYYLAGGMGISIHPSGIFISRNLTPDRETGIGKTSNEAIANALRNGRSEKSWLRVLNSNAMPWPYFHALTEDDATSIATYLKSLPPVRNYVPYPLRYGFLETALTKLLGGDPVSGSAKTIVFKEGSYGYFDPPLTARDMPQTVLIYLQILVFLLVIPAFIFSGPPEHRVPHSLAAWLETLLAPFIIVALITVGWFVYKMPEVPQLPPNIVSAAVTEGLPDPLAADLSTQDAQLALRGKYLYTVTSCLLCHGADGRGGMKMSSRGSFGTVWSANISQDNETGIGSWTDAQIARAVKSGVSADGRALHWQNMPWDHFSNMDEEDTRALIRYLRIFPSVKNEVPAPVAATENDCENYTIFIVSNTEPGCK